MSIVQFRYILVLGALFLASCGHSDDTPAATPGNAPVLPTLAEAAGMDAPLDEAPDLEPGASLRVELIDPCTLLTHEEAETIVRARLLDARPANLGSERPSCTYGADPTGPTAQVQVFVGGGAESLIAVNRRLGGETIDVDELGDDAFLRHTTLHFHPSGVPVVVSVVRLVDAASLHPAMIAAARTIAERLAAPSASGEAVDRVASER